MIENGNQVKGDMGRAEVEGGVKVGRGAESGKNSRPSEEYLEGEDGYRKFDLFIWSPVAKFPKGFKIRAGGELVTER